MEHQEPTTCITESLTFNLARKFYGEKKKKKKVIFSLFDKGYFYQLILLFNLFLLLFMNIIILFDTIYCLAILFQLPF